MWIHLLVLICMHYIVFTDGDNCERKNIEFGEEIVLPEDHPVIYKIQDSKRHKELQVQVQKEEFLANHGDKTVQLTSSNAHSHGKRLTTLNDYITNMNNAQESNGECDIKATTTSTETIATTRGKAANETWYLFGSNEHRSPFSELSLLYDIPKCSKRSNGCFRPESTVVSGIGGKNSGVSFHFHGPGFSEVITGKKRWFLYPPEYEPDTSSITAATGGKLSGFESMTNTTVLDWINSPSFGTIKKRNSNNINNNIPFRLPHKTEYDRNNDNNIHNDDKFYDCTIVPGEVLYFPTQWQHATLNLEEYTFFVSVFLP